MSEQQHPLHDEILMKVWGEAGGGAAGRRAIARLVLDVVKQAAQETDIVEANDSYYAQLGDAQATKEAIIASIGGLSSDAV